MKNKDLRKKPYEKLIRRLFFQTVAILVLTVCLILALRFILKGHVADNLIKFFSIVFNIEWDEAHDYYQHIIRNNLDIIMVFAIVCLFFLLFRLSLSWFTRYFDQIVVGIDQLAEETENQIKMYPELAFMEVKLNQTKDKLVKRTKEVREAEQRKTDLLVYLAHDLKTPLTSVIGYLTLLRDETSISQELRARYTGIALDKAERLENLINEFFDITRFNLTTMSLDYENINLSRMLEQIANEFNPILAEKGLYWETAIQPDIEIVCDPDKLERVFDNLIRNAVNYSYPQTDIRLLMLQKENLVEIQVCNRGKTIAPEKLNLIFQQFFRLDSSRSSATGGAGLGLAISKEIVELHGGTIAAQSVDESIVFTVLLPVNRQKII